MQPDKKVRFDKEDVDIKIPSQARKIGVRKQPLGTIGKMPGVPGGFHPIRLVLNFEFFDEDSPQDPLSELDEPAELRVRYTSADKREADKDGVPLSMAYYMDGQWNRFTAEKHSFRLEPDDNPAKGGYAVAFIRKWGDPPVGVGK